jgi:hypothetical protein
VTVQTLTLSLPEPIYRYLEQMAAATRRPVEQVAQESIVGNLPPSVASMPVEAQGELLKLQSMPMEELQHIAASQVPPVQQARHQQLLEKNANGTLTPADRAELAALRTSADHLMLRKAYAWAVLRWRGQPIPTLNELPLE